MSGVDKGECLHVLLVEDNPADVRLTEEALRGGVLQSRLTVVEDGLEAMAYLRGDGVYAQRQLPDLVLLDLNLPRMDGRQVLREMQADDSLRVLPVIVLSTSSDGNDIRQAYQNGANCFVTKPLDVVSYFRIVNLIEEFWGSAAHLPRESCKAG